MSKVAALKDILPINVEELDAEWATQPEIYWEFAKEAKKAELQVKKLEAKLDLFRAQLARRIRQDPQAHGLPKATEAAIADIVVSHPDYQVKLNELLNAKYKADLLKAVLEALRQRRDALSNLVQLLKMEYFNPEVPEGVEPLVRERLNKARQKVQSLLANDRVKTSLRRKKDEKSDE